MVNKNESRDGNASISLGQDIALLRVQLNMTQQQFAEALSTSRITINKIENSRGLSLDIAFRLFYATAKIMGNQFLPRTIREHAKLVQKRIDEEVLLRSDYDSKYSPISYTPNS